MNIQDYEKLIIKELDKIVEKIIVANPKLPIAVKKGERVGDAISKFLENKFVEFTQKHTYFKKSVASPQGKTKNPFDVETVFELDGHQELIWIDFKALNIENQDTNPDSGTPDKVITLMQNGYFYLVYVIIYYIGLNENTGLEFVKHNDLFVKSYFLKNVSATMRITPANQMQVNGFSEPLYRTREEFLDFLLKKKIESNERKLKKAEQELENFKTGILKPKTAKKDEITIDFLKELNKEQEEKIKNINFKSP
ncbi:MAG: hypothetical protein COZ18_06870 [Flexibacter sp. CG_4_10_14_3_um_filter_32_15]|nr:MAG: hypothetical protein COZ18_06870 [Flexibacter sp. CG_4_10_14_3_um_filter_32_15]